MKTLKKFTFMNTKKILLAFLALTLINLAPLKGFAETQNQLSSSTMQAGTILSKPRDIVSFNLIDENNQPFSQKNLQGHWSLLFFGFTGCPNICPTTFAELKKVAQNLNQMHAEQPQIILVSIDPEEDTPAQLKRYVSAFNPNFKGLTGSSREIDKLTHDLNVVYLKTPKKNGKPGEYDIDHSGTLLLVNPQGQLAAFFSMPHQANKIAQDLMVLMKNNKD